MEDNELMEELFGPDPNSISNDAPKETEDELFSQITAAAGNEDSTPESTPSTEPSTPTTPEVSDDDSFTDKFLARIGISDKNAIPWKDSSGAMFTRSWDSLTENEQLDILSSANTDPETDLDDSEIRLINQIRESGLDADSFMKAYAQQIQDNYANQNKHFDIDDWTDDEVYAIDLMNKLGENVTEEELTQAIQRAKENEAFYTKEVAAIRENFRQKQQEAEYRQNEQVQQEQEAKFQALANSIVNEIKQFNTVAGRAIELDYQDQNNLANYLLARDNQGNTKYSIDMQSPQAMVQNAFWALYGPQFLQEAEAESARAFKRGYEQAKKDLSQQAAVEIRSTKQTKPNFFNS